MTTKITSAQKREYEEIVELWEASVRSTHDFLAEADVLYFRRMLLEHWLAAVDIFCVRDGDGALAGFLGLRDKKIEMLFLSPDWFGKGLGKELLGFAVNEKGATKVDVNEQNQHAAGFYAHMGFRVVGRSSHDDSGKPYPLLHMELVAPEKVGTMKYGDAASIME
ncbi:MAG: GNAT family N-acetyltransferase [Desulfovibrionaceae bacterium]